MNKPIIEVKGLGKKYRIGAHKEPYLSLRDSSLLHGQRSMNHGDTEASAFVPTAKRVGTTAGQAEHDIINLFSSASSDGVSGFSAVSRRTKRRKPPLFSFLRASACPAGASARRRMSPWFNTLIFDHDQANHRSQRPRQEVPHWRARFGCFLLP